MVGPVRSGTAVYFVRWAAEFRSAFAHYGGDTKTLEQVIRAMDGSLIYDVDALWRAVQHSTAPTPALRPPRDAYTSDRGMSFVRWRAGGLGGPATMMREV